MATKDEKTQKLTAVFKETFQNRDLVIARETTAQDVEGWDSLAHVQLIIAVETAFGIKFKLREIMGMKNVGDMIDLIDAKTA